MKHVPATCLALALSAFSLHAEVVTEAVAYKAGDTVCEGFLAYDKAVTGARPGVLIAHQWKGLGDYEKKRAVMLAELGYTAFAVDVYGQGVRPANPQDAGALAGRYKGDRALLRSRMNAGFEVLKKNPLADPKRLSAIGYCFGGTAVLELARGGAELNGVVSFHGGLSSPTPADAKNIRGKVLVLHGADDPFVKPDEVAAFGDEMRAAKVDWQLFSYGGAVHAFSDFGAGNDNGKGAAYNEAADRRSWAAMKVFFGEVLK